MANHSIDFPSWISQEKRGIHCFPTHNIIHSMLKSQAYPAETAEIIPLPKTSTPSLEGIPNSLCFGIVVRLLSSL